MSHTLESECWTSNTNIICVSLHGFPSEDVSFGPELGMSPIHPYILHCKYVAIEDFWKSTVRCTGVQVKSGMSMDSHLEMKRFV